MEFQNKTVFISGGSRGIGKAIALRLAAAGANIIIAAKSTEEDPKLGGTIYSAAEEVEKAGGKSLAVKVDIRIEAEIEHAIKQAADTFGGIDIVINNASAIQLANTEKLESKRFDLMLQINVRGTLLVTKHALPYLKRANNPHILTLSPPISLDTKWFAAHAGYTITKYAMSMLTLGWAAEFKNIPIAANALWPKTTIDTAAVRNLLGGENLVKMSRKPEIVADAAFYILKRQAKDCSGNLFIDEAILASEGITDLQNYAVVPGGRLYPDLFT